MSFAYHAHGTADMHVVMNPAVTMLAQACPTMMHESSY